MIPVEGNIALGPDPLRGNIEGGGGIAQTLMTTIGEGLTGEDPLQGKSKAEVSSNTSQQKRGILIDLSPLNKSKSLKKLNKRTL